MMKKGLGHTVTLISIVVSFVVIPTFSISHAQTIEFLPPVKLTYTAPDTYSIVNIAPYRSGFLTALLTPAENFEYYLLEEINPAHQAKSQHITNVTYRFGDHSLGFDNWLSPEGWLNADGKPYLYYVTSGYQYAGYSSSYSGIVIRDGAELYSYSSSCSGMICSENIFTCTDYLVYEDGDMAWVGLMDFYSSTDIARFVDAKYDLDFVTSDLTLSNAAIGHTDATTHPLLLVGSSGSIKQLAITGGGLSESEFYSFGDTTDTTIYHCATSNGLEAAVLLHGNILGWSRKDGVAQNTVLQSSSDFEDGEAGRNISWFDSKGNFHAFSFQETITPTNRTITSLTIFFRDAGGNWTTIIPSVDYSLGEIKDGSFEKWDFDNPQIALISDAGSGTFVSHLYFNGTSWELQEVAPVQAGVEYVDCFTGSVQEDPFVVGWRQTGNEEGYYYRTSKAFTYGQITPAKSEFWGLYE